MFNFVYVQNGTLNN